MVAMVMVMVVVMMVVVAMVMVVVIVIVVVVVMACCGGHGHGGADCRSPSGRMARTCNLVTPMKPSLRANHTLVVFRIKKIQIWKFRNGFSLFLTCAQTVGRFTFTVSNRLTGLVNAPGWMQCNK